MRRLAFGAAVLVLGAMLSVGPAWARTPVVHVKPSTDLFNREHVRVSGARFTPGEIVDIDECNANFATTPRLKSCAHLGGPRATDSTGAFGPDRVIVGVGAIGTDGGICDYLNPCVIAVIPVVGGVLEPRHAVTVPIAFRHP